MGSTEKRIERSGRVTFEQCHQEVMTKFLIRAVKHHENRGKMKDGAGKRQG